MITNYKYYSLKNILKREAQYNIIIGERSNGKTYAVQKYGLENYFKSGKTIALVRRWKEDFRGKRAQQMFSALVDNREVERMSKGEFNSVTYRAMQWTLCKRTPEGEVEMVDNKPFCYGFALSDMEHDKSVSYPDVTTILFDEFLTRGVYLQDEFVIFMNVLSTIIRQRTDVKIFLLGNTVNKYCPYFSEFGLNHIKKMGKGTIDVYKYGSSSLKVAVEYCDTSTRKSKPSDVYFAFNNPRLEMIKNGEWEIDVYPHLPGRYKPKDVVFTFFIDFKGDVVQCEVVCKQSEMFVYCHLKTSALKYKEKDLIYNLQDNPKPNIRRTFLQPMDAIDTKICRLYKMGKFFYQNNEIGEVVRNFIQARV